jgi:hypothetical protein
MGIFPFRKFLFLVSQPYCMGNMGLLNNLVLTIRINCLFLILSLGTRGGALVEALRYKPEGRGIGSQW